MISFKAISPISNPAKEYSSISSRNDFSAPRRNSPDRKAGVAQWLVVLGVAISAANPRPSLAQGTLSNGITSSGTLTTGETNSWTFSANAGDSVVLRMGSAVLNPRLQLLSPLGTVIRAAGSGNGGFVDTDISLRVTNTGTFTVQASTFSLVTNVVYMLTLAKAPGTFSSSDEGGPMLNGALYTGSLQAGDLDMWSFEAQAGDGIVLRMGATNFNPWIRLFAPDGALVGSVGTGNGGFVDVDLMATATNSGTYIAVVASTIVNTNGNYWLTLGKARAPIVVSPGDQGGPMTNGWKHGGALAKGDLDVWSFDANAGDGIVLRMGATNFNPWIRLYGPNGALVGASGSGNSGFVDPDLKVTATNTGTFTVVAGSVTVSPNGNYTLSLAKAPGQIFVAPLDEGGPLTNGWKHTGSLEAGDLDVWSFDANAGDSIVLRMGATNFNPWIRLFGPNGALVGSATSANGGFVDPDLSVKATNTGTFTVVAARETISGSGNYTLTLAKSPGAIFVAPMDEGGPLTNGWMHTGALQAGDLDVYSFPAIAGDGYVLRMGSTNYNPWLRLYGPDGQLIGFSGTGNGGFNVAEISGRATNAGMFTVVAASIFINGNGSYILNLGKPNSPIGVSQGDEGGALIDGRNTNGAIVLGDLDVWSFSAGRGQSLLLHIEKLSGDPAFTPWMRLYGPSGALVGSAAGNSNVISLTLTNSGLFTVVVGDAGIAYTHTGNYQIGFQANVTLTGHVYCLCNSNAIPGASIQIGNTKLTSDASGVYSLSPVAPGTYTATVTAADHLPLTTDFTVDGSQLVQTQDFYLTNTTFIVYPILDSSITQGPLSTEISNTIHAACQVYSQLIADPVCVRILFSGLAGGDAQAVTRWTNLDYAEYVAELNKNPNKSDRDLVAIASLNPPPDTGLAGNTKVWLVAAVLDAIGRHDLADAAKAPAGLNSYISLPFSLLNITRPNLDPQKDDLQSVAMHEINEALGIGGIGSTLLQGGVGSPPTTGVGPLDLYRFEGPGQRSFSYSPDVSAYFSIRRGTNLLIHFNQNNHSDYGDWIRLPSDPLGNVAKVQDAGPDPGTQPDLGPMEEIALDVIGYTLLGATRTLNPRYSSNGLTLSVETVPGQTYQVQSTPQLIPPSWHNIGLPFMATGSTMDFTDIAPTNSQQFYRVTAVPPINTPP